MNVSVKIGEWAAGYSQTGEFNLAVPEGATVEDVILMLKLPPEETGLCAVEGKHVTRGHVLSEGDNVKFFPSIIGG